MNTSPNRSYESALHAELGMTDAEIRAELVAEGLDPDSEAAGLRSMINALTASIRSSTPARESAETRRFVIYEESVSAGHPAPSNGGGATESDILDILRASDKDTSFWARVSGLSMRDEGILDKDLVLVDSRREPRDGDIVLAYLQSQGQVIKRLRLPNEGGVILESANPDFAPIHVKDASSLIIHGVVTGRAGRV